jgi:heme/copper-type cytochrome/quinol oxidase subunit 2
MRSLADLISLALRSRVPGIVYGQCSELCGVGHGFMSDKASICMITIIFLKMEIACCITERTIDAIV